MGGSVRGVFEDVFDNVLVEDVFEGVGGRTNI